MIVNNLEMKVSNSRLIALLVRTCASDISNNSSKHYGLTQYSTKNVKHCNASLSDHKVVDNLSTVHTHHDMLMLVVVV